jgi:nucleoside-diphosphate-sugar epimerase
MTYLPILVNFTNEYPMKINGLAQDLNFILQQTRLLWAEFKNQNLFITGGTGFIGTWLLETLAWANRELALNLSVTCLTRDVAAFARKAPHLVNDPALLFITGDVKNFNFPTQRYHFIIHAAAEDNDKLNLEHPRIMFETIVQGTRHVLDFSSLAQTEKLLFLSSGAVYGQQPANVSHVAEDFAGSPDIFQPRSAYGIAKRTAEHLCVLHAMQHPMQTKIARCFAFVGPYLPLNRLFAIGNFMRDGMQGNTIAVKSDGSAYRSYLYAADLVIWLLTILCEGNPCVAYNVGSDQALTIGEVAHIVANSFNPRLPVHIAEVAKPDRLPARYVPDVSRAQQQLLLTCTTTLSEAIYKTLQWYAKQKEVVHG